MLKTGTSSFVGIWTGGPLYQYYIIFGPQSLHLTWAMANFEALLFFKLLALHYQMSQTDSALFNGLFP